MELSPAYVALIGVIATIAAQLIKLYLAKSGRILNRKTVTVLLFIVATPLAYLWLRPALPAFPALPAMVEDPGIYAGLLVIFLGELVIFAGHLVTVLSAVVGAATAIYNLLGPRVFALVGWSNPPVKTRGA